MVNPSMWLKAIRVIPRLSRDEWNRLDVISRWLIATRAAVLVMTFVSAAIAGLLAARAGKFDLGRWLLLVVGLVFAHALNNLLNDYTDYRRGVDRDNYFRTQYGPQPLQQGLLSEHGWMRYAAVTALAALAAGVPLVAFGGWRALWLLALGAFFVLFYTYPLKYIGLGEIAVIVVWGPLMIGGGYYVITGGWDWNTVWASLPFALGATTVIFGKHIDKRDQDQAKNIHTLPVLLGEKTSRYVAMAMIALQYGITALLVIRGYFGPLVLAVVLAWHTLPRVLKVFRRPKPAEKPADYDASVWPLWFSASAFYHNRAFGLTFLAVLVIDTFLHGFIV